MNPMNSMQRKVGLVIFLVGVIPLIVMGGVGYFQVKTKTFESIRQNYSVQLYHISTIFANLLTDTSYDIKYMAKNPLVRNRHDAQFTSFLTADENQFNYHIGKTEQAIVDLFNDYKNTHPYINSVYMGRENGSFVRSHPRQRPTQYDPRIRPWYRAALKNPGEVVRTAPYPSLTSPDINIGIVKALVDENQQVFGVIGVDITLADLCKFMTRAKLQQGNTIIILDETGRFLTHDDPKIVFKHFKAAGLGVFSQIYGKSEGYVRWSKDYLPMFLFFRTLPENGWKICVLVPANDVKKSMNQILALILFTTLLLIIVSGVSVNYFSKIIFNPFNTLVESVRKIRMGSNKEELARKIEVQSRDEVAELANSYNRMCAELLQVYGELDENMKDIKELDRLKSAFVAMVSHELRTPLASIKGYLALLNRGAAGPMTDEQKDFMKIAENNSDRLNAIINDLLDVSKIESGVFVVNKQPGDIVAVIREAVRELSPAIQEKSLRLEIRPAEDEMRVCFDQYRMIQTLIQIIRNAVQFSPVAACVTITVEKTKHAPTSAAPAQADEGEAKGWILLSVTDQGPGVPRGAEMKIFEKFYQSDDINTRHHQGIGIGLSIARGLVNAHGGVIWAESNNGMPGLTVKLLLPVQ